MTMNAPDMSLDDVIKRRSSGGRGRGRGRGRGFGEGCVGFTGRGTGRGGSIRPFRVNNNRTPSFNVAKSFNRAKDLVSQHDLLNESMRAAGLTTANEPGTKMYISNLDVGVSNDELKELFSAVGLLKTCDVHYDMYGQSNGSAEVVFVKRADAVEAMKRYNSVFLDGKPMKVQLVGLNVGDFVPLAAQVNVKRRGGSFKRAGYARGRGRGIRGRKQHIEKTAGLCD